MTPDTTTRRPPCRHQCGDTVRAAFARHGAEVTVSTARPPILTGSVLACPHGVPFYVEPTAEQLRRWREDTVP